MPRIPALPLNTAPSTDDLLPLYDNAGDLTGKAPIGAILALATDGSTIGPNETVTTTIDQTAHGFVVGNIVRHDGSSWVKAQANTYNGAITYGMVSTVTNANTFVVTLVGRVTGLSGLVAGTPYFLSATTAGTLQAYPPAEAGTVVKPLLLAITTTTGVFNNQRGQINAGSSVYSKLGMNVGNDVDGATGSYPAAENARDLAYLRQYVNKIRVKLEYHLDVDGVGYSKQYALDAKAMGFYVIWGVVAGAESSAADYATWRDTSVPAAALWASENGIDEFQVFNEEDMWAGRGNYDGGGISDTDVRADVLTLATTFKAAYPNMRITGSSGQETILGWQTAGTGDFDRFGFNVYDHDDFPGTLDYFQSVIGADKFFVTEWAYTSPYEDSGLSDDDYKAEIAARLQALKDRDIEGYFFTWRSPDYGAGNDSWAVRNVDDSFKPGIDEVFTASPALTGSGQIVDATERAPVSSSSSSSATGDFLPLAGGAMEGDLALAENNLNIASEGDDDYRLYFDGANDGVRYNSFAQHAWDIAGVEKMVLTGTKLTIPLVKITGGVPGIGKVLTSDADGDATWETATSGGIIRAVTSSSGSFTAGATAGTDYVYLLTAAHVPTMPTAVGNTNRYSFKNNHSASITFLTTGGQTIDGGALVLGPSEAVDLISNNANWLIF